MGRDPEPVAPLHVTMAGHGNPYAVLTSTRLRLLLGLHDALSRSALAALTGVPTRFARRARWFPRRRSHRATTLARRVFLFRRRCREDDAAVFTNDRECVRRDDLARRRSGVTGPIRTGELTAEKERGGGGRGYDRYDDEFTHRLSLCIVDRLDYSTSVKAQSTRTSVALVCVPLPRDSQIGEPTGRFGCLGVLAQVYVQESPLFMRSMAD
jgi:hypothetical protein